MSTAAKTITTANLARKALPARVARRAVTSRTARRAISAAILARVLDPSGKRRAARRRQRLLIAGAVSGALLAVITTAMQRRRSRARAATEEQTATQGQPRTAGTTDVRGHYRSRHGEGAGAFAGKTTGPMPPSTAGPRSGRSDGGPVRSPLDTLAAHAEHIQNSAGDEAGFHGHLGFGISGSLPVGRASESFPTGGGDALGGTVRGGDDAGYADEIVTGAGEAMNNSTTPSQNGAGHTLH